MDTNVILKYRRPEDSWACPNCESENGMPYNRCALCGYERTPSVQILKAWSPELERAEAMAAARNAAPMVRPMVNPSSPSAPVSTPPPYSPPPKKGSGGIIWVIVVVLIIIALVAVLSNSGLNF